MISPRPSHSMLGSLGLALTASYLMPASPSQAAPEEPASIRLPGVVRDFTSSHADFGGVSPAAYGHSAGNVSELLGDYSQPIYTGSTTIATPTGAKMATGTYVGNETDNRIISGLDFAPDLVFIKADDGEPMLCRTESMPNDKCKRLGDSNSMVSNRIQTLNADGFTIGSNEDVNDNGKTFFWAAFKETEGALDIGSYGGNDQDNRTISGIGFRPDYVIVMAEHNKISYQLSSEMETNRSLTFGYNGYSTNKIQRLLGDGFEVGNSSKVNDSGKTYHYIAFKEIPGFMEVGSYVGNNTDNRNITGVGFKPQFLIVRAEGSDGGAHRYASQGNDSESMLFTNSSGVTNAIQEFQSDGFQVGTRDEVNDSNTDYYYMAFTSGEDGAETSGGFLVANQWQNKENKPFAPHLEGYGVQSVFSDFTLSGQSIVPGQSFSAMFTVLGGSIYTGHGDYHMPVTCQIQVGGQTFEPFGSYDLPVNGNLNNDQSETGNQNPGSNPRQVILPNTFSGGSAVTVSGRSWLKKSTSYSGHNNSHWEIDREEDSADGSNVQIEMLVNGMDVPNMEGAHGQDDVEAFLTNYIADGKIVLCESQAIFLFELGVSGSDSDADFQDLVVLVTLANDLSDLPDNAYCGEEQHDRCGNEIEDTAGTAGTAHGGHVTSAETFDQWFRDYPGINSSVVRTITLTDNGAGVYEYADNAFYPIDQVLFGNEGNAHNDYFTFAIQAEFVYNSCSGQFFEFESDDDTWMFVGDELVVDLGGVSPGTPQRVELDRLSLNDGDTYVWRFFHARRQSGSADFNLSTNVELTADDLIPSVSSAFD